MKHRLVFLVLLVISIPAFAQKVKYRKTQEVNFDGSNIDGKVRNPNGAYVVQRRGIDFVPIYKVRESFDKSIKESVEYLR